MMQCHAKKKRKQANSNVGEIPRVLHDTSKRPRRCQSFVGDLQLLERLHRDHVEARTPIEECLGDGDVVDGGEIGRAHV